MLVSDGQMSSIPSIASFNGTLTFSSMSHFKVSVSMAGLFLQQPKAADLEAGKLLLQPPAGAENTLLQLADDLLVCTDAVVQQLTELALQHSIAGIIDAGLLMVVLQLGTSKVKLLSSLQQFPLLPELQQRVSL